MDRDPPPIFTAPTAGYTYLQRNQELASWQTATALPKNRQGGITAIERIKPRSGGSRGGQDTVIQ